MIPSARLGPYQILASLGAGGMGEVYKARDTRLDRTVAIKTSIIAAILEGDSPSLAVGPITPSALERIVRKCLAKDPDRRWQSAADLCDELSWISQARRSSRRPSRR